MTMKKLVKNWALPDRTQDRLQLTLRLNYDLYAKLHALKEVYPTRSVNEMINDILVTGLDEIIEALPVYKMTDEEAFELACHAGMPDDTFVGSDTGPRVTFNHAYRRLLESKASDDINQNEAA